MIDLIQEAVVAAGYKWGEDIKIALDAAATELYDEKDGKYHFPGESKMLGKEIVRTSEEMVDFWKALVAKYPLVSLEDGLAEEDWAGSAASDKGIGRSDSAGWR